MPFDAYTHTYQNHTFEVKVSEAAQRARTIHVPQRKGWSQQELSSESRQWGCLHSVNLVHGHVIPHNAAQIVQTSIYINCLRVCVCVCVCVCDCLYAHSTNLALRYST